MELSFTPLQPEHAGAIVVWSYEPPYDIYNISPDAADIVIADMLDPQNHFYAVLDGDALIGFRSFGPDGQVPGGEYDASCIDTGGGLRPDLTGKGLGAEILQKGLEFGARELGADRFRVTIATFNQRAIKVCKRVGFEEGQRFRRPSDRREFVVLTAGIGKEG